MLKLQFVCGDSLSSKAIAWFSAGHLSHVDAVMPGGKLLGARSDHAGGEPSGVRERPRTYLDKLGTVRKVVMEIPASAEHARRFYDFLGQQLGKPYDRLAIFAFAIGRDWRTEGAWYCSELQAAALEHAGVIDRIYQPVNKVTPVMLAVICSAIRGHKVLPQAA